MKKDALGLLILSMILNGALTNITLQQLLELRRYREYHRKSQTWMKLVARILKNERAWQGLPPDVVADIRAYLIFADNDMV